MRSVGAAINDSPYAGGAEPGGLAGCTPAKNRSLLHQARATPAPGGATRIFGETLSPQTPRYVRWVMYSKVP